MDVRYVRTVPADMPTILATSGGHRACRRTEWEFSALTE
jgi:hypothetical protein